MNLKDDNNEDIATEEAAEHINNFFANVGKNLAADIEDRVIDLNLEEQHVEQTLDFRPIELEELTKELNSIDVDKSSGIDHVSARVLKDCLLGMVNQFLHLLNMSISNSIFP